MTLKIEASPLAEVVIYTSPAYTAAANVRLNTDRGDGVTGTLDLPPVNKVLSGYKYDGNSKTGTLEPTSGTGHIRKISKL